MVVRDDSIDLIEPAPSSASGQYDAQYASEYTPSVSSSDRTRTPRPRNKTSKGQEGKPRWISQVKDWFSTGEPSAQDFKHLKKQEFKKRGIAMNDPNAHAKMHAPIGQIPGHAIKTAGGPNPDKMAVKRAEQRKRKSFTSPPGTAGSASSRSSSSTKLRNPVAPWER